MFRKLALALSILQLLTGLARAAGPDIGKTIAVKNEAVLESGNSKQPLTKGLIVHQDEIIVTGADASAQVELLDKTKLAVGPEARIVLDKFVYNASASRGSISVNLTKGAFRFITGIAPKSAYEITTPTASLGVRGTIFDVFVADDGETAVLLHDGGVEICNVAHSCQLHDRPGWIVHVSLSGDISPPVTWDGSFMTGISVRTAFPFVGKSLAIDPVRRRSVSQITGGTQPAFTSPPSNIQAAGGQGGQIGVGPSGTGQPAPFGGPADLPPDAILAGGLAIAGLAIPLAAYHPLSP